MSDLSTVSKCAANEISSALDDWSDLECPYCGGAFQSGACLGCHRPPEIALGVPFFGGYQSDDILHLIEIAAHVPMRESARVTPDSVETIDSLCRAYEAAPDKEEFKKTNSLASAWWFQNRYSEWTDFNSLTVGLDLTGRKVLDIGAGPGFDTWRLYLNGAKVTAIESNPLLASLGQTSFPEVRYLGGFSHALPFANEVFDFVFINAALHHMHDLEGALQEAIRVLKVCGYLITTGDPFRASSSTPNDELKIFDKHTGVLSGINESVIRLAVLVDALRKLDGVDVHCQLKVDYAPSAGFVGRHAADSLDELASFEQCSGSVGLRLKRRSSASQPRRKLPTPLVRPSTLQDWLSNQSEAMSQLSAFIVDEHVNAPFPGANTKFQLLNGWRLRAFWEIGRRAYVRGRWFLRRKPSEGRLSFEIKSDAPAKFDVLINGGSVQQVEVGSRWKKICVDLRDIAADQTFALEISRQGSAESFDANCFSVRRRKFRP
jgi:SAM-dependent methyltransferase